MMMMMSSQVFLRRIRISEGVVKVVKTATNSTRCLMPALLDAHYSRNNSTQHPRTDARLISFTSTTFDPIQIRPHHRSSFVRSLNYARSDGDLIDFKSHRNIYNERTFWDVLRSMAVLKLCAIDVIANNSLWLMEMSQRILGQRLYEKLMRSTFYGHFVAGITKESVLATIKHLEKIGMRTMIFSAMEKDGETPAERDAYYDLCASAVLDCIKIAQITENNCTMTQIKLTGLIPAELLQKLSNISKEQTYDMIDFISNKMDANAALVSDFEKLALPSILNKEDQLRLANGIERLKTIGNEAYAANVITLVDAEYTSLNKGINIFALAMMKSFNKKLPIVWNTYQCYLKNAYCNLTDDLALTSGFGICFAAKIVRGAYMTQERESARKLGIADPIHATFSDTTSEYHRVADHMLEYIHNNQGRSSVMIASHNHETIRHVVNRMKILGKKNDDPSICFGQVFGVADHVSYTLSRLGYTVYKSSPWGPVNEAMPYLYRRAMENRAVLEKTKCEIDLLTQEIKHRLKRRCHLV